MWRKNFLFGKVLFISTSLYQHLNFYFRVIIFSVVFTFVYLIYFPVEAREYVIFSIAQEVPMGIKGEKIGKNYYINMGAVQGLQRGTIVDVFRSISIYNPYQNDGQYSSYRMKVGELSVVHSDEEMAIANASKFIQGDNTPLIEFKDFMIGDQVQVHVDRK